MAVATTAAEVRGQQAHRTMAPPTLPRLTEDYIQVGSKLYVSVCLVGKKEYNPFCCLMNELLEQISLDFSLSLFRGGIVL